MARKSTGGGFVTMTKSFEEDMADCSLAEIGLMSLLITSKATTPVGTVYRRHEWSELPGSSADTVTKLLEGLEAKGKIVRDHHEILIRSWVRHRCFSTPNFLKACKYTLEVQMRAPLLRVVVASELLRKDIASIEPAAPVRGSKDSAGRVYTKGRTAHYEALELIWDELTGQKLPPAETINGSITEPNATMLDHLMGTRDFEHALAELENRNWVCIEPSLAVAIRERLHGPNVKPIRGARTAT